MSSSSATRPLMVASAGGTVVVVVVEVVVVVVEVVVVVVEVVVVVAIVVVESDAELRLHDTTSNASATNKRNDLLRGIMMAVSVSTVPTNTMIASSPLHNPEGEEGV